MLRGPVKSNAIKVVLGCKTFESHYVWRSRIHGLGSIQAESVKSCHGNSLQIWRKLFLFVCFLTFLCYFFFSLRASPRRFAFKLKSRLKTSVFARFFSNHLLMEMSYYCCYRSHRRFTAVRKLDEFDMFVSNATCIVLCSLQQSDAIVWRFPRPRSNSRPVASNNAIGRYKERDP